MMNLKPFIRNTQGNFAIMGAVAFGVIALATAVTIEISSMQSLQTELQDTVDAAALTAAIAANKKNINGESIDRLAAAQANLKVHMQNFDSSVTLGEPIIKFDDVTQEVTIELPAKKHSFFSGLLNQKQSQVRASSSASYEVSDINPVSLAFVVDVSGSMGWCPSQEDQNDTCPADEQPRINTLQNAVGVLFDEIEGGNANINDLRDKVRTGIWTYRSTEGSFRDMANGWGHVEQFVNGLTAQGGTHSTDAFKSALDALTAEAELIKDPNHKRFIVFMTDGANNDVDSTLDTEAFCLNAKEQGINIYSVAFAAPIEGENLLLQCASPNDDEEISDPGEFDYDYEERKIDQKCDYYTDPSDGQSNGRKQCEKNKADNYFDADNEEEFRAAFAQIGAELGEIKTRLTR